MLDNSASLLYNRILNIERSDMGYKEFTPKDPVAAKITQNAKKFGEIRLQNEILVKEFLNRERIRLDEQERAEIEKIFINLMKIEEDVQLSG